MSVRQYIQVLPTNLGDGIFSDRNGLAQIIFEIPQVAKIMNGKSLRINGTFCLKQGDGSEPSNATEFFEDAPSDDIMIDGRTGVSSIIETLSIQNLQGATYSTIKSYNRMCASLIPLNESIQGYLNGCDTFYGGLSKDVSTAKKVDKPFDFSLPLLDGFLQGNPIDMQLVKGLRIVITLAPSNYVVHNNYFRNNASTAGMANGGAYYELSNMICSFETEVPPRQAQEAMVANQNGVLEYNTYTSFYSVLNSNDYGLTLNINTGRTLSVIANMIPSEWLNNYHYNSSQTMQLLYENGNGMLENKVPIRSYTFTRGGVRIPLDFELDSEITQINGTADSVKVWEELNIIRDGWSIYNFEKSLKTELSYPLTNDDPARFDRSRYSIVDEDKRGQFNMGVGFDKITYNGFDFRGSPFGLRIQSIPVPGVSLRPHSIFLFVKHKCTAVFQNGGVQIIS
jgi:hypothetical protein